EFPTVEVRDGRTVWLEILPEEGSKGIRLIMVKTDKIKVPGGRHVGSRYSEIFGNKPPDQCEFGLEEYSDNLICHAGDTSRITFIFEPFGRGPDGGFPSIDQIKSARVIGITWSPYRGNPQ